MRIDMKNVFARRVDPGLPWRLSQPAPAVVRQPRGHEVELGLHLPLE
jgi:hypothetical protein